MTLLNFGMLMIASFTYLKSVHAIEYKYPFFSLFPEAWATAQGLVHTKQ